MNDIKAYVDGSYRDGKVSWGLVIVKDNAVYGTFSGVLTDAEVQGTRQVAGELRAVKEAVFWAKEQKLDSLNIYYDYEGIQAWVTGIWKAKKAVTQEYRDFMHSSKMAFKFFKIKSHSGDKYNDLADKLASDILL